MKALFTALINVFVMAALAFAQTVTQDLVSSPPSEGPAKTREAEPLREGLSGYWEGNLRYCGSGQPMSIEISLNAGVYSAVADIPDIGTFNQSLEGFKFDGHSVQFQLPVGRGRFEGKLQNSTIIGNTGDRWDDEFVVTAVFQRKEKPSPPYVRREIRFTNGQVVLAGTLFLPRSSGRHPAVVAVHGATGRTRDNPDYRLLAELLPPNGIAVLLYDGRGAGQSTGTFLTASFADLAKDAIAGVRELMGRPEIDPHRIGLWGISQGGWVLPQAAVLSNSVAFLIVVSGMDDTAAHQMDYLTTASLNNFGFSEEDVKKMLKVRQMVNEYYRGHISGEEAEKQIQPASKEPWFPLAFIHFPLPKNVKEGKWFYQMDFDPAPLWKKITIPVLVLYGENDQEVPSAKEASLFRADLEKAGNQAFVIKVFPSANHELLVVPSESEPWHWRYIAPEYQTTLVNWIQGLSQ